MIIVTSPFVYILDFRCYGYEIQSTDCNVPIVNKLSKLKKNPLFELNINYFKLKTT